MSLFTHCLRQLFIVLLLGSSYTAFATLDVVSTKPASAGGGCDGSITFIANGSAGDFEVLAIGPTTTQPITGVNSPNPIVISNLCAGTYEVAFTNRFGCVNVITTVVTQCAPITIPNSTQAIQNPSQCGSSNGSINLTGNSPTGGVAPYSFLWNTGATTPAITGLSSGTYTLTVTGTGGCSSIQLFTLSAPNDVQVFDNITGTCSNTSNGSVSVYLYTGQSSGGSTRGPYTFRWSNGRVFPDVPSTNPTSRIDGLVAGTYSVTIEDFSNTCLDITKIFTVPSLSAAPLVVTGTVENTCPEEAAGAIQLQISGGVPPYEIYWDNSPSEGSNRLANLLPGSHCAKIVDRCGAIKNECFEVPLQQNLTFDVITTKFQHAPLGALTLAPTKSGTYTYQWSTGATGNAISNLSSATYYVTVTNTATGCSIKRDYFVKNCADVASDFEVTVFGGSALDPTKDVEFNLLLKPGPSYSFGTVLPAGFTIEWSAPDGTVLGNGFALTLNNNTTYDKVIIDVSNGCSTKRIEKTILKCDTQGNQVLKDAFIANQVQPCIGDVQGGQITLSIPNISGMTINVQYKEATQPIEAFSGVPVQIQGGTASVQIGGLSGIKNYDIKIMIGSCNFSFNFNLGEKEPDREFVKNEKEVCFYRLSCNGNTYGGEELFQEIGTIHEGATLAASTNDCATILQCGDARATIYFSSKRVRASEYEQILYNARIEPPFFFSTNYTDRAKGLFESAKGIECLKVRYCQGNLKFIRYSPHFLGKDDFSDAGAEGYELTEPGCNRVLCQWPYDDYIFCGSNGNPDDPILVNCKLQKVNLFSLYEGRRFLEITFGDRFRYSELASFIENNGTNEKAKCASVTFCEDDFRVIGNTLGTTSCGESLLACAPFVTCQLETDETGNWVTYCRGNGYDGGCVRITVIREDKEYPVLQDIFEAERRVKMVNDAYQSEELINFGISKDGIVVNPDGLISTQQEMVLGDFHPLLQEVKKDSISNVEYIIEDWEHDYMIYAQRVIENKESNLVFIDTNNVKVKSIVSDTLLKIRHLSTLDKDIFVGGTFSGELKYDSTVIANSDSAACFLLRVSTDGTVQSMHIIKNVDLSNKAAFSENRAGSIVLAAKHNGNVEVDSTPLNLAFSNGYFALRIDSTNQVQLIKELQGGENMNLLDVTYSSDTLNPFITLAFDGTDTLNTSGEFVFVDSVSRLNLISLSQNGAVNWTESIVADSINLDKFDLTYGEGNSLFAAITFKDTIPFLNQILQSKGGEDLALVKIGPNGVSEWQRTYGTIEDENVSQLLYNYGSLYFGGEFTGSVGDKTIGKYVFSNLIQANTKAYISYILDEAPQEGTQQLTARPSAKIIVAKSDNIHNVQIYPNPFKDVLYIDYTSEEEGAIQMELLNTIGMSVLSQKFEAVRGINTFSIETKSNVALGVYYLKITDKEGNFTTHKVVH